MRLRTEMPVKVKAHTAVFHKLVSQTDIGRFESGLSGAHPQHGCSESALFFNEKGLLA